jgi:hypothetical protein
MLQMSLCLPNIARLPQATPADALCVGTLDPCPRGILLREGVGRLPVSCGLERLVRFCRKFSFGTYLEYDFPLR